ncbi:MAG: hypothetical protein CSB19_00105 [Clostridiales bacterium]|nr:MAG: hypothetical protein CSB19_00105 [Clostridiales bacterium]
MNKKYIERALSVLIILSLWQLIAMGVGKTLIFPSPISSLAAVFDILAQGSSLKAIYVTFLRVLNAFAISTVCGIAIGFIMHFYAFTKIVFSPLLRIVQTAPVMSFIMLALLWIETNSVAVFVGLLIGLPIMATATLKGLNAIDPNLIIMSDFFEVQRYKKLKYLYMPAIFPFLELAMKNALSLTWKVCVAAEVLAYPQHAIGSQLINAKNLLETERLFAWTFLLIVLGVLSEYALKKLLMVYRLRRRKPKIERYDGELNA